MGLCLARQRGQEKIVDGLERGAGRREGGGETGEAEMIEPGEQMDKVNAVRGG